MASFLVISIASAPLILGAIRLARFNVGSDDVPSSYFTGLPTPINAISVGSLVIFIEHVKALNPEYSQPQLLLPIIFSNMIIFSKEIMRTTNFNKIYESFQYKITNDPKYLKSKHYYVAPDLMLHEYRFFGKHEFYEERLVRPIEKKTFSSNRVTYWKEIVLNSERPFLGYGALGDKFLINRNSSNAFIYSYVSGGFITVLILIIIFARYTFLSIKFVLIDKMILNNKNLLILSSIFTISFLMYRSLVEVGVAVFSIDFIIFLTCIAICEKSINKK